MIEKPYKVKRNSDGSAFFTWDIVFRGDELIMTDIAKEFGAELVCAELNEAYRRGAKAL